MNCVTQIKTSKSGVKIFDMSLKPENASNHGYEYIDDIIYDTFALNSSLNDILLFVYEHGYKLGIPSQKNNFDSFYGLYAPIK